MPSTCHVTAVFVVLTTVAVNSCVWIEEIDATAGVTLTTICGLGGGGTGASVLLVSTAGQPATRLTASRTSAEERLHPDLGGLIISIFHRLAGFIRQPWSVNA